MERQRIDDVAESMARACARCGGRAFYWQAAVVPGDPSAPQGSLGAAAHAQPAWACVSCGYLQPFDRRAAFRPPVSGMDIHP